jgi:hypothetical protein
VLGNAATKPLNVLVLAAMLAAAFLITPWIAAAAVPVYGLLVAATVRDPAEAERLLAAKQQRALQGGARDLAALSPPLRGRVEAVLAEEREILRQAASLTVAPEGLGDEVRGLGDELVAAARRAAEIDRYLGSVDRSARAEKLADYRALSPTSPGAAQAADALAEQLRVIDELAQRRQALDEELDHVEAGLGTIRARLVQASADAVTPDRISGDVNALRMRMRVLTRSLAEAYGQNADEPPPGG